MAQNKATVSLQGVPCTVSWPHLLFAPLLFSFQQTIAISPFLPYDAGATIENPILFFSGYLSVAVMACFACCFSKTRKLVDTAPIAAPLLLLALGTLLTCAQALLNIGSPAMRLVGGICIGLSSTVIFLKWCEEFSRLEPSTLIRTTSLCFALAYAATLATSLICWGAIESLTCTLGAVFASALPLEPLSRGRKTESHGCVGCTDIAEFPQTPLRKIPPTWWNFVAAAFVTYSITGFSWGNALFNHFDFLETGSLWLESAGAILGCLIVFSLAQKHDRAELPTWPLLICVGLLLVGWLIIVTLGEGVAFLTAPLTGIAFGMLDSLLLSWACLAPRREEMDPIRAGALAWNATLLPIMLGILLIPLLQGAAATLVSPLAGVAFFIAYQLNNAGRENPKASEPPAKRQLMSSLSQVGEQAGLSPRELDVFLLLAHGHSSGYIAEQLNISSYTVKTHVKHIYTKLDVHTKDEFLALLTSTDDCEE